MRGHGSVGGGRCEGMGLWEVVGARDWVCERW